MKPGQQLVSAVCTTKVVIVRVPQPDIVLACGGQPMREPGSTPAGTTATDDPELCQGTALGKRYIDETTGLEVLCVSPGDGSLTCNGVPMVIQGAKPLPSSD
jgi:hypothetical protein